MDEELLHGGIANAGAVVRSGDHVLRPSNPHSVAIHEALSALRAAGFHGASKPIGIDADGRERLEFIEGDVPIPPYPEWARSDETLASIVVLVKGMHDASATIDLTRGSWKSETADPLGGPVLCHNDVCLENVVFHDGRAVALLDFEFAAPGRRVFDLASLARMCVPIDDEVSAKRLGWSPADLPRRLRLVCDSYGLGTDDRFLLLTTIDDVVELHGDQVRGRVKAGEPGFVTMWEEMGGEERLDRRHRWWSDQRSSFERALE